MCLGRRPPLNRIMEYGEVIAGGLAGTKCALKFTTECENMTDPASDAEDEMVATGRRQINAMRTVNKTQKLMSHW